MGSRFLGPGLETWNIPQGCRRKKRFLQVPVSGVSFHCLEESPGDVQKTFVSVFCGCRSFWALPTYIDSRSYI